MTTGVSECCLRLNDPGAETFTGIDQDIFDNPKLGSFKPGSAQMVRPGTTARYAPFWFGSGFGEIADPDTQPAWRDLEIGAIDLNSTTRRVQERRRILSPFAALTDLDCKGRGPLAKCLVVVPQSGHFSLILRDLIAGLLSEHDVSVLDWINARHVPLEAGEFGFDDTIATIVLALQALEGRAHLIGVCQSAIPAIIAAVTMHQTGESA